MGVFQDRHIVVTGGTGALGSAVVSALVEHGGVVHVPCLRGSDLDEHPLASVDRVRLSGPIDLTEEASVEAYYEGLPSLWASIQCAGGFQMSPLTETSAQDFERMHAMNALSCFLCCREATRSIRSGGEGGRLVNVGAMPAIHPVGGMTAYAASKAAVVNITQSLAAELAPEGILVNGIIPSIMDTPANRAAMPDADHESWPRVEDIAEQILAFVSPANRVTRGTLAQVLGET